MLPNPPKVEFDAVTHAVSIVFDPCFEFAPEARVRLQDHINVFFPPGKVMDNRKLGALEQFLSHFQTEAIRRGEMRPIPSMVRSQKDQRAMEEIVAAEFGEEADDGHEPGEVIVELHCPCCGAALSIEYGEEPGQIVAIGEER